MTGRVLDPVAALVRRHDPDRFLCSLFAPARHRPTLFLLYAFNHELARAREVASQPGLALIRLHWWREVAEGARRKHEVAGPLGAAIDRGALPAADLAALVDAREAEVEDGFATATEWEMYLRGTAGALTALAGRVLGADGPAQARLALMGTAYGVAGQLRAVASLARHGRCLLPGDALAAHGLTPDHVIADPTRPELAAVRRALAARGLAMLRAAEGAVPAAWRAAALLAVLARRDLHRPEASPTGKRGLNDRIAVAVAGLR